MERNVHRLRAYSSRQDEVEEPLVERGDVQPDVAVFGSCSAGSDRRFWGCFHCAAILSRLQRTSARVHYFTQCQMKSRIDARGEASKPSLVSGELLDSANIGRPNFQILIYGFRKWGIINTLGPSHSPFFIRRMRFR